MIIGFQTRIGAGGFTQVLYVTIIVVPEGAMAVASIQSRGGTMHGKKIIPAESVLEGSS